MLGESRPLPRQKTSPGETLLGFYIPRAFFPWCPLHYAKVASLYSVLLQAPFWPHQSPILGTIWSSNLWLKTSVTPQDLCSSCFSIQKIKRKTLTQEAMTAWLVGESFLFSAYLSEETPTVLDTEGGAVAWMLSVTQGSMVVLLGGGPSDRSSSSWEMLLKETEGTVCSFFWLLGS